MKYLVGCMMAAIVLLLSSCKKDPAAAGVAVTAVGLDKSALSILVNHTDSLKASVSPADATNGKITWSTSDNTLATVDAGGHITTKATGNVTITATSQDGAHSASCAVKVADMNYFVSAAASYSLVSEGGVPTENVSFTINNKSAYPVDIIEWDVYNSKNVNIGAITGSPVATVTAGAAWNSATQSLNIGLFEPGQTTLQDWAVLALFKCQGKSYELSMTMEQALVTDL